MKEDEQRPGNVINVDEKVVISPMSYELFCAGAFDEGNLVEMIRSGILPRSKSATDPGGMANGVLKYHFQLKPGGYNECMVSVPFYGRKGWRII